MKLTETIVAQPNSSLELKWKAICPLCPDVHPDNKRKQWKAYADTRKAAERKLRLHLGHTSDHTRRTLDMSYIDVEAKPDHYTGTLNKLKDAFVVSALGLLLLQVLDIVTTVIALNMGGAEANPFMAGLMRHPLTILVVKVAVAQCLVRRWRAQPLYSAVPKGCVLVGFYALTVLSNSFAIYQLAIR